LAVGTNPPQVIWCRVAITGLTDLKGKKVRVFNKTMTDFMQAIGASAASMAFAEVVPALHRGVVDCAVTGTMSGFTAGWPEAPCPAHAGRGGGRIAPSRRQGIRQGMERHHRQGGRHVDPVGINLFVVQGARLVPRKLDDFRGGRSGNGKGREVGVGPALV
jgi:hypothetical protein|tara:strand:- start:133 stop:615 length:483 start_codon:yes stop_codon:yes gene_type:complete